MNIFDIFNNNFNQNSNDDKKNKKHRTIGIVLLVIGIVCVFVNFILFATAGESAFDSNGGFSARIIIPFILIPVCMGFIVAGSVLISKARAKNILSNLSQFSDIVEEEVENYGTTVCEYCQGTYDSTANKCPHCGAKKKKTKNK